MTKDQLETRNMAVSALHEEALSCAIATLNAITVADYFGTTPQDPDESEKHNHGCWLLSMLSDHLRGIDARVTELYSLKGD